MRSKTKDVDVLHRNFMKISYQVMLEKSKNSDYRLFGGVKATLVFQPRWGLPNNEELSLLCEEIRPMMFTQLWRKWDPINIPESTKQIDVIGFKRQNLLEDEDFDTAFPSIEKSEFDCLNMTSISYRSLTPSSWSLSSGGTVQGRPVSGRPSLNSSNTAKISYAAISRK